jgi:hypothetical protein
MKRLIALSIAASMLVACGSGSPQRSSAPPVATPVAVVPTASPAAPAALIVCEYYNGRPDQTSGKAAEKYLVDAASAAMVGGNEALPLRKAITEITLIAAHDPDPTEKKDLTTLADALDTAALSGGGFADWDPAFEAFHVKYAERCGQQIAQ